MTVALAALAFRYGEQDNVRVPKLNSLVDSVAFLEEDPVDFTPAEVKARKFSVGDEPEQGVDPVFVSKRRINDANLLPGMELTPGARGFSVSDVVDRGPFTGVMAYAGYEARFQIGEPGTPTSRDYNHINAFQANPFIWTTGTTTDYRSYQAAPVFWNGAVTNYSGFYHYALDRLPGNYLGATALATLTNVHAVYIEALGLGTDRYAFKSVGSSDKMDVAGAATFRSTFSLLGNATIGDATGDAHTVNGTLSNVISTGTLRSAVSDGFVYNLRANSGQNGRILFTEDSVADRWSVGTLAGDSGLYFDDSITISNTNYLFKLTPTGAIVNGTLTLQTGASVSGIDTDGTLAANSNSKIATQKATKTYADGVVVAAGSVIGPASATDGGFARYNGITGKLIKDSAATISLTADVSGDLPLANLAQGTARSVLGVTGNATADYAPIQGTASQFLNINAAGTALAFVSMSGDATLSAGAITLASVITAGGPTGSATVVPVITYDAKGRLTTVTTATITPAVSSITGLGTGVATALGVNVGSAGAFVTLNGAGGTPSSLTLTNATGLPISTGVSGLAAGIAAFLATPSSANLITAVTDETGSGALVFGTSPTLVTPLLGTPTSGTLTNCTGLPAAGLVASTSQAVGFGSIELGHASDTTLARASAGDMNIEGNIVYRAGGTDVAVADGGTNFSSYAIGDLLQASASGTLAKLAAVATGNVLISGGVGTVSSWGKVALTTHVSGTLPVANGGTGDTGTAWAAFTPTVTSGSGTITTYTATGHSLIIGKTMFIEITITITTAGTGAGTLNVTNMPGTSPRRQTIVGCEDGSSGKICYGKTTGGGTILNIVDQNGATVIVSGARVQMTGVLEIS